MSGGGIEELRVHGEGAEGFAGVREEFERNFAERGELGAACCAYVSGEKVVDLWGGLRDRRAGAPWEEDTLVLVFSTTKGVSALAVALVTPGASSTTTRRSRPTGRSSPGTARGPSRCASF